MRTAALDELGVSTVGPRVSVEARSEESDLRVRDTATGRSSGAVHNGCHRRPPDFSRMLDARHTQRHHDAARRSTSLSKAFAFRPFVYPVAELMLCFVLSLSGVLVLVSASLGLWALALGHNKH